MSKFMTSKAISERLEIPRSLVRARASKIIKELGVPKEQVKQRSKDGNLYNFELVKDSVHSSRYCDAEELAEFIYYLEDNKISNREFAKKVGCSQSNISQIKNWHRVKKEKLSLWIEALNQLMEEQNGNKS